MGIISRASANALKQYASAPDTVLACNINSLATSVSGAPPPAMRNLFLTRQRMTHRASWRDLSASSRTNLLEPLITMEQVLPGVAIPVILTALLRPFEPLRKDRHCKKLCKHAQEPIESNKHSKSFG